MKTVDKTSDCSTMASASGFETMSRIVERVESVDWKQVSDSLDSEGNAVIAGLLTAEECAQIASFYPPRIDLSKSGGDGPPWFWQRRV